MAREDEMGVGAEHPRAPVGNRSRITILPTTVIGRWSVGLAVAFLAFVLVGAVVPRGAALGLLCGIAGGIAALLAIVRDRDRAVTVFAAVVPLAIAVAFVLAELVGDSV